jgi:hypothetical protein
VDEQPSIIAGMATLRAVLPRIVRIAREAQDPTQASRGLRSGLRLYEGPPHSDSRAKKATAFLRMSRFCVTCARSRFTRVSPPSGARRGAEPRKVRVRPLPFSCSAHL